MQLPGIVAQAESQTAEVDSKCVVGVMHARCGAHRAEQRWTGVWPLIQSCLASCGLTGGAAISFAHLRGQGVAAIGSQPVWPPG